jgi:predicted dienelactone hydrolase
MRRISRTITSAILGCLCMATAAAGQVAANSTGGFDYPRPTGRFQVGTSYLFLEDSTRHDAFSDDPDAYRWISVRAWYPAEPADGATPVPLGYEEFDRLMVAQGVFDSTILDAVTRQPSASFRDAPFASQGTPFPILIFSSSGVITANKFLSEELASHGYVVFAVGHPYWCEFYFDGDGGLFFFDKSNPHYVALWEEEDALSTIQIKGRITRSTDVEEKTALFRELNRLMPTEVADLALWSGDVEFLIDRLVALNGSDGLYRGHLDTDRIGIIGYSKGGANAAQVVATSDRVRAGVNLGGFMFGGVVEHDLQRPFMILDHVEPWCQDCPPINLNFFQRSRHDAYVVQIDGANHASFTDLPLISAYVVPEGIVSLLDGRRSASIINAYVLAFFDTYVKGLPRTPILDEVSSRFEEVRFYRRTRQ